MNILLINYMETTFPGGINKVVREIGKYLSQKHEVTIIQLNPFNLPKEEFYKGIKIIRIKSRFGKYFFELNLEIYPYIKKNFKKINPDIIHVHGYHTLFSPEIMFIFKKIMKIQVPIFFTPHYDPLNHSKIAGKLLGGFYDRYIGAKVLNLADYVISISEYEANNIKKLNLPKNLSVVPNGINYINKEKKNKEKILRLLYVGYLLDYKGVQDIIKSVHNLIYIEKFTSVKLTIIGEGKYKKKLINLSIKNKVCDFIIWKPFMEHSKILEEMKKSDILLLLSRTEGYGIVVAESLAMGTPTIVTKKTALEEFTVEKGCFGVDCPPNPIEVARLILKISRSDIKIGPFTKKIKTWKKVADEYEKIYYKQLNKAI